MDLSESMSNYLRLSNNCCEKCLANTEISSRHRLYYHCLTSKILMITISGNTDQDCSIKQVTSIEISQIFSQPLTLLMPIWPVSEWKLTIFRQHIHNEISLMILFSIMNRFRAAWNRWWVVLKSQKLTLLLSEVQKWFLQLPRTQVWNYEFGNRCKRSTNCPAWIA